MFEAFLIVALVLFVLAAFSGVSTFPYSGAIVPLGLAFLTAAFLVGAGVVTA